MPKFILLSFPDGAKFEVPAKWVAELRADYYVDVDFRAGEVNDIEKAKEEEVEFALSDSSTLIDYFQNNMNWDMFRTQVRQVAGVMPEYYEEDWDAAADLSVVEHD